MRIRTAVLPALLAVASVTAAPLAAAAQSDYQVIRAEDSAMTCEALIADINSLNAEVQRQAENARRGAQTRQTAGRLGRGLLSGLAQGAQMMAFGGGGGDALAQSVATNAIAGVAGELANGAAAAPPPPPVDAPVTPQSQRLTHLNSLYGSNC